MSFGRLQKAFDSAKLFEIAGTAFIESVPEHFSGA